MPPVDAESFSFSHYVSRNYRTLNATRLIQTIHSYFDSQKNNSNKKYIAGNMYYKGRLKKLVCVVLSQIQQ